jgi:hypothetical protein
VELELDASSLPKTNVLAVLPEQHLAALADSDTLYLLRPRMEGLRDPTDKSPFEPMPQALAVGAHGLAFADDHRVLVAPKDPGPWRSIEALQARDLAWNADGRLAAALRADGVLVVHPNGEVERHPLPSCCLGVAWRGSELAVVGRDDALHVRAEGAWRTTRVPGLTGPAKEPGGGWDVEPWGDDGWVISDYRSDEERAHLLRGDEVVRTLRADGVGHSFDLAVRGTDVLVAAEDGGWWWDGASETALRLDVPYAMGVTWVDDIAVVGSSDQTLHFFDRTGTRLHAWRLDDVPISLDYADGVLAVATPTRVLRLAIESP